MAMYRFTILTVSDRCSRNESVDTSGPLLQQLIKDYDDRFYVLDYQIVSDDKNVLKEFLIRWSNRSDVDCILTTGGTGLTSRDITPETTAEIIEKEVPGISLALISSSLSITPMAMLSRMKCGILNQTLIINLPGSYKACKECFDVIKPVLKHAIDQLKDSNEVDMLHRTMHNNLKSKVNKEPVADRERHSPFEMISIKEAQLRIFTEIGPYFQSDRNEMVIPAKILHKAFNLVLAHDVFASVPLPPFDASTKDGYAVIAEDGKGNRNVLSKASIAGLNEVTRIDRGFCARISTGAAVPAGANAVVQVEDTELIMKTQDDEEKVINIKTIPAVGQDIRLIGSDIPVDNLNPLITKYRRLSSIDLGLIAATGAKEIKVFRRPKIAVLSTGDEIVSAGQHRSWNCVWDSNRTVLMSLLLQFEVFDLGITPDSADGILNCLNEAMQNADVIITTGGVSMGERDLLKKVLREDFNADIHFGRINLKPGKPTTFSTTTYNGKKKYIFSLPGNPVSAFVTFKIFVEPFLQLLSGKYFDFKKQKEANPMEKLLKWIKCKVVLDKPYQIDTRPEFVRAVITFSSLSFPEAKLTESNQTSSRLLNVMNSNGLLFIPSNLDGQKFLENGDFVDAILF
ncbi:molybdenum cofactor synthesis protein cinnamon [Dermatophagoides pteronyssinus]|uniref:molybdenum cofactor synthesis protein cinnamon n=1 Tax=Dermatophagoides pteronyssinus TaxID=6956 RepID=UPI003F662CB3